MIIKINSQREQLKSSLKRIRILRHSVDQPKQNGKYQKLKLDIWLNLYSILFILRQKLN